MNRTQRSLVLLAAFAVLATALILYAIAPRQVNILVALIPAAIALVTFIADHLYQSDETLNDWANDLRAQVEKAWAHRRQMILGDAPELITRFSRIGSLEHSTQLSSVKGASWEQVQDFFLDLLPQRLVILGEPGSGKTLMALQLLMGLLAISKPRRKLSGTGMSQLLTDIFRPKSNDSEEAPKHVPVPISIAGWDGRAELIPWLTERLRIAYNIPRRRAKGLIEQGYVLPILDGLDEASGDTKSKPEAQRILFRLNNDFGMVGADGLHPVVITCRTSYYAALPMLDDGRFSRRLSGAAVVMIEPLARAQVIDYLTHQGIRDGHGDLVSTLRNRRHAVVLDALSNPLTLALASRVIASGRLDMSTLTRLQTIEEIRRYFVAEYLHSTVALYPKNFGSIINVAKRERELDQDKDGSNYRSEDVRRWLGFIAEYLNQPTAIDNSGGTHAPELYPQDLWEVAALHKCPVRLAHLIVAIAAALVTGTFGAEVAGGSEGVACWCIATVLALGFALRVALPQRPKLSRVDFRQLTVPKTGSYLIPAIAVCGIAAGLLAFRIGHNVSIGITEGVAAVAFASLLAGRSRGRSRAVEPLDGLRNDLRFGFVVGVVGAFAIGLPRGLTGGLWSHLHLTSLLSWPGSTVLGALIAIPCGVALCSGGWVRVQLGSLLSRSKFLPRRPLAFLRWSEAVGLMRVSGITYQFRHEELFEWLLEEPKPRHVTPSQDGAGP